VKVGEIRRRLRREGWEIVRRRGSHEQWKHPGFDALITLYGKDSQEPSPGVIADIRKKAGWK